MFTYLPYYLCRIEVIRALIRYQQDGVLTPAQLANMFDKIVGSSMKKVGKDLTITIRGSKSGVNEWMVHTRYAFRIVRSARLALAGKDDDTARTCRFLLKTEHVIIPLAPSVDEIRSTLATLDSWAESNRHLQLCDHRGQECPAFVPFTYFCAPAFELLETRRQLGCPHASHLGKECDKCAWWDRESQGGSPVSWCKTCWTDYSKGWVHLPAAANADGDPKKRGSPIGGTRMACVLTSWKDLGTGQFRAEGAWNLFADPAVRLDISSEGKLNGYAAYVDANTVGWPVRAKTAHFNNYYRAGGEVPDPRWMSHTVNPTRATGVMLGKYHRVINNRPGHPAVFAEFELRRSFTYFRLHRPNIGKQRLLGLVKHAEALTKDGGRA